MLRGEENDHNVSWTKPNGGLGVDGHSQVHQVLVAFFTGLGLYNAIELVGMVFLTFRKYNGTYFWSLLVAAFGIVCASLCNILKTFDSFNTGDAEYATLVLGTVDWWTMVTGQALVLWSRLHLVLQGPRSDQVLRWTRRMIITNAMMLHVPTTILTWTANRKSEHHIFVAAYAVMEKIQMSGFYLQETILSLIYIWEATKILRTSRWRATYRLLKQLILINAIIIAMDLGVLLLEATARHILQILVKNLICSIKLKLEFAILGKLVRCVGSKDSALEGSSKTCVSFITAVPKLDAEDMEGGATGATDPDLVHSNIICPSRSDTRTHKCDLDYRFARFRHLESIATLQLSPAHFQDSLQRQHVTPEKEG